MTPRCLPHHDALKILPIVRPAPLPDSETVKDAACQEIVDRDGLSTLPI